MHAIQEGTPPSAPVALNAEIVRLLDYAGSMLGRDSEAARSSIRRASALLRGGPAETSSYERGASHSGGLAPWQCQRVIKHIDSVLGSKIRIADLAAITRLSVSYFARAFKSSFGESPYGYILGRRLERARELMLTTGDPLCQVALSCGFADQAHMTKMFRQIAGQTPGAWRRMNHVAESEEHLA